MSAVIGALRGVLSLDSAAFEKGAKRAQASMSGLQRSLARSSAEMKKVGRQLSLSVTAPLAAASAVAVKSSLSTIDAQAKMAQSMGTTTKSVQVLARAGDLAGVSMGQIETATVAMTKRLSQAAAGSGSAVKALDRLNLSAEGLIAMPLDERIAAVQTALTDMVPEAERAGVAAAIFGDKASVMFARIDPATLRQAATEVDRFGVAVSDVDADKVEAANDAMSALGLVTRGLANQMAVALAPVLQGLAEKAQALGQWFNGLSDRTKKLIGAGVALTAALGPALVLLGTLGLAISAISSPVLIVVAALGLLGAGAVALASQWDGLAKKFPLLGRAADAVQDAFRWLGDNMGRVGHIAAGLVAPFALVGIAAWKAGEYLASKWDGIRNRFPGVASALESAAGIVGRAFSVMWDGVKAVGGFAVEQLELAGQGIIAAVQGDWATAAEKGREIAANFKAAFDGLALAIGGFFRDTWEAIREEVSTWPDRMAAFGADLIQKFLDGIKSKIQEVKDTISGIFDDAVAYLKGDQKERLRAAGADTAQGLAEGFASGKGVILEVARENAEALEAETRKHLETQSPSRLFRRIGEDTVEGFIQGIERTGPDAVAAIVDMASDVTSSFDTAVGDLGRLIGDGMVTGFESAADQVRSIFKRLLTDLVSSAASNQIRIAMGLQATGGGGAGIAQTGANLLGGGAGGGGGLTGALLGSGSFLGAVSSGFSGVISQTLAGGLSHGISTLSSTVAAGTTSIGAFGAAIGAVALPALAIAAIFVGMKKKIETLNEGLQATVTGMDVAYRAFERQKRTSWFGLSKEESTRFRDAGREYDPLREAITETQNAALAMAETLGIGAEAFNSVTRTVRFDFHDKNEEERLAELQKGLGAITDAMAEAALASAATTAQIAEATRRNIDVWQVFAKEGEGAGETLSRLSVSLAAVNDVFGYLNKTLMESSVAGASAASALVDLFGGVEQFTSGVTAYIGAFYTEEERLALLTGQLTDQLADLNTVMPRSRLQFRALVDAQDLTTKRGRELYAMLIQNAAAFAEILPEVQALSAALLEAFTGTTSAVSAVVQAAQANLSASKAAAAAWYTAADGLRDLIRDIDGTDLGGGSAASQLAANRAAFAAAVEAVKGGDVSAAGDVTALANAYLTSAAATAQSGEDYRLAAAQVRSQVQLLSGIADFSGANEDVLAELYQKQIDILENLSAFLQLEGLTAEDIEGLDEGLRTMLGDFDGTVTGFETALGEVTRAIEAVKGFNYNALQKQIDVVIRTAKGADLPEHLKTLIKDGAKGIRANVDFILRRDDLTPDLKWIATRGNFEALQTLKFVAKNDLGPRLTRLAVSRATRASRTIRFIAQDKLPPAMKRLALSDAHETAVKIRTSVKGPKPVRTLLSLVEGGSEGKITLAGAFRFDPSKAFGTALQQGVENPMKSLRESLKDLRATIREEIRVLRKAHNIKPPKKPEKEKPAVDEDLIAKLTQEAAGITTSYGAKIATAQTNYDNAVNGVSDPGDVSIFKNGWFGGAAQSSALKILEDLQAEQEALLEGLRKQIRAAGGVPSFATGGWHLGGLRLVGENGPELEATGPARIYSARRTQEMLGAGAQTAAETRALRNEVASMRRELVSIGLRQERHGNDSAALLKRIDKLGLAERVSE